MKTLPAALVVIALVITGASSGFRAATFDADSVSVEKNVMVPMRDGVRLATDVYRPAADGRPVPGRFPLLLMRTPYNKDGSAEQAQFFARHGYIVAVQDERGAYGSEGVLTKYIGYGADGYDAIEWLAKLPYTDGQVGMWGTSYAAHTQAAAAIQRPPHLRTIVLNCGGLYNGWMYKLRNHGAFELAQQITWAFGQVEAQTKNPLAKAAATEARAADWVAAIGTARGLNPLSLAPNFEDFFFEMMTNASYGEYWKHPDRNWSLHYDETADIPMLHITGWYDSYTAGTILNYVNLSKTKQSPMKLLVGPWLHGQNTTSTAGEVEFGPSAAIPDFAREFHLRWFDRFLKGANTGADRDPAVKVFVMGTGDGHRDANGRLFHGGYWKTAETWPLPGTKPTPYYLHGDGTLGGAPPAAGETSRTFTYDPRDPVPTIGGSFTGSAELALAGAFDQRERPFTEPRQRARSGGPVDVGFFGSKPPYLPLKARRDVLVYQTSPLAEDTEVVGPVVVTLFATSSAVDTDFTAKLVDVYPPSRDYPLGFEMNVTDGIIRARYRNSPEHPEPMTPGQAYRFQIEPFPTANVFKKGHRIRLDISSSNFPRFDVNPNTGGPLGTERRVVTADNTVYHDASHPSAIVLPVLGRPTPPRADGARPYR